MSDTIVQRKKLGRKALPEDKKRIRLGCRVSPKTMAFLKSMDYLGSVGKIIDWAASVADTHLDEAPRPKV